MPWMFEGATTFRSSHILLFYYHYSYYYYKPLLLLLLLTFAVTNITTFWQRHLTRALWAVRLCPFLMPSRGLSEYMFSLGFRV